MFNFLNETGELGFPSFANLMLGLNEAPPALLPEKPKPASNDIFFFGLLKLKFGLAQIAEL